MSYKSDCDYGNEARVKLITHLNALAEDDIEMTAALSELLDGLNWSTGEFERRRAEGDSFVCMTTLFHKDGKSMVKYFDYECEHPLPSQSFFGDIFVRPMRPGGISITYSMKQLERFCLERREAREEVARAANPGWAGW
jgi:hypothetical protein